MTKAGKRVGLLHHVGNGNLGDEATLAAVSENIRKRWPDAEIVGLSMNPSDTSTRHGIPSYPIRYWTWNWKAAPSTGSKRVTLKEGVKVAALKYPAAFKLLQALYRAAVRAPLTVIGELLLLRMAFRVLRSLDVLIICGGLQLIECSGGSWKFPFTIFKWMFAARLCRVKCVVLNVGAGPIVRPLSRRFVRGLLTLADYASVRDEESRVIVRGVNFTGRTRVVCDSNYLLEKSSADAECSVGARGKGIVGFAPTQYGHGRASNGDFVGRLAAFGSLLVKNGHSLRLFCADIRNDPPAVQALERILRKDNELGQRESTELIRRVHQWTTEELLRNMSSMEFVVTSRFETVVFAHILNMPLLAISDQPEVRALMNGLGLGEYCVDSGDCDLEVLAQRFSSLVNNRDEIKRRMADKLATYRRELAIQFDELFPAQMSRNGSVLNLPKDEVGGSFTWLVRLWSADDTAGFPEIARKTLRRNIQQLQRWPRAVLVTAALLMVALIGLVDYATGFEASLSVFYLSAIALAAWFVGRRFAVVVAILSVAVSLATDLASGARFSSPLLPIWNTGILLSMYFVVVGLLAIVRSLRQEVKVRGQKRSGTGFCQANTSRLAARLLSTNFAVPGSWTPSLANCISTALLMMLPVGVVDYLTGTEVSCSAFYLPAVGLAAWFAGASFAFFIALLSVMVSLSPGLAGYAHFSNPLVVAWNAGILLSMYLVVVVLLAHVRSLQREAHSDVHENGTSVASALAPSMAIPGVLMERFTGKAGDPCTRERWAWRLMEIPVLLFVVGKWLTVSLITVVASAYLALSQWIWARLPAFVREGSLGRAYGRHLHSLVCRLADRKQNHSTFFLRNRPELELLCRLLEAKTPGSSLDVTVFACSKGAEVYSILWAIRSVRPDLNVRTRAVDISQEILDFAEKGVYSLRSLERLKSGNEQCLSTVSNGTWKDQPVSMFERMTEKEVQAMFEIDDDQASIRPWLKQGITWQTGDAGDPELVGALGLQDIVVANRFLCHMAPEAAERCLRNVARTVKPGGYLFVSGVDLRMRTRVARSLGWKPVEDLVREVHEGDASLRNGWPFGWWGLEPFSTDLPDWKIRYACVFQIGEAPTRMRSEEGEVLPKFHG